MHVVTVFQRQNCFHKRYPYEMLQQNRLDITLDFNYNIYEKAADHQFLQTSKTHLNYSSNSAICIALRAAPLRI